MKADRKTGFTLVELMIAIAASAIVMLTVGVLLVSAIRSWRSNNAYVDMRRDAAFAMEMMARDIRQAEHDGAITAATNSLIVENTVVGYSADFSLVSGSDLAYSRDGSVLFPRLAGNVARFVPSIHVNTNSAETDGLTLRLEMENTEFNISFTNETFIYIRNPSSS